MRLQTLLSQDALEVSKFSNFLLRLGEGTEPEDDNQMIHIDNKFVELGDSLQTWLLPSMVIKMKINQLPGDGKTLLSADYVEGSAAINIPNEFVDSITTNGMLVHRLYLKCLQP